VCLHAAPFFETEPVFAFDEHGPRITRQASRAAWRRAAGDVVGGSREGMPDVALWRAREHGASMERALRC